jgi:hypothetical protein
MEVGDFLIISGVFVIGSTLPTTLPNRTVKLVTTEAPYFLIQSDDDKFLTITTEFDPVLSLGFTANTEFWIKNTSPTPREVLFDTDIEFVGSPLIPTNGLAILKLIEVVGGVEYWSVNHLLANGTGGGGGDFIPLSGTEVGSPITGLIELKGGDGVDNPYLKFTSFFSDIKTYISYASNIDGVSYTGDFSIITKDETSESIMRFQPHEIEFQFNGMSKLRINENSIQGLSNFNKWFFASDTFDVQADVFFYDADEKAFAVGFADPTDSDTINFEFAIQNYSARIHSDFEDCKGIVGNRIFNKQSDYNAFAQLGDLPFANIQTSNFTAVNLVAYSTNGTVTVTDPTPETNKGYIVHVVGGTTTIGGVDYTAGALVYRFYDGTDWTSKNYGASGSSATNLGYTPSPTNGTVTSSTGTDAIIPLADGTNAGLLSPTEKSIISNLPLIIANGSVSSTLLVSGVTTLLREENIGSFSGKDILKFDIRARRSITGNNSRIIVRLFDTVTLVETEIAISETIAAGNTNWLAIRSINLNESAGNIYYLNPTLRPITDESSNASSYLTTSVSFSNPQTLRIYGINITSPSDMVIYSSLIQVL